MERAFLVAVTAKGPRERRISEDSLAELEQLANAAGASVVGRTTQQLPSPDRSYYVGKGKLQELINLKGDLSFDVAIFDDELSPLQQRNLEDSLSIKVIDRAALILDIFARRARTHEGRLQVALAQHQYLLPRLAGQWSHLERLGGGIGTRGPGESQLETDRRIIRQKIQRLKKQTDEVSKQRSLYRRKRQKSGIPIVALVGYTSAGKSTLLNALCQADVFTEAGLFATLDPTTRRFTLPDHSPVLFTDTVGFIRKLPPDIIDAFKATLEELSEASLLLHVVDLSSSDAAEQCRTVEGILTDLGLSDKPRITVLNKIDRLLSEDREWDEAAAMDYLADQTMEGDTVLVSATRRWGLAELVSLISRVIKGRSSDA